MSQEPEVSNITAELIDMLRQRDAKGRAKYGATLDRADLTLSDWLLHMAEEMLDGAGYALAGIRKLQEQPNYDRALIADVRDAEVAVPVESLGRDAEPCGGCGNSDPSKRCIGCGHNFTTPEESP